MEQQHILVVEDDEVLRIGICDLLDLSGYIVTAARDGQRGLEALEEMRTPPALIVSDIRMPNMDGYEFLSAVRSHQEWVSIPFIFLSAKGDREDIRKGKLQGADDYISKPFEFQDLLVAIQSSLSRHDELVAFQEARMETLKRRILEVINHEFRTPLTYIVAYADLMASEPSFQHSDDLNQYITGILEGSERLSRLIENFLVLAELESGLGEKIWQRRRTRVENVGRIVDAVVEQARAKSHLRGVTIKSEVDSSTPPIEADPIYLEIAIRELIHNAIRFSPEDEAVNVVVHTDAGAIRIDVRDEGPGIAADKQDRLFDTFYQVDRESLEQGGAGAGLAIARHVAQLHGGDIEVESAPGEGSLFCLRLPIPA